MSDVIGLEEAPRYTSGRRSRCREALGGLFPPSAEAPPGTRGRRLRVVAVQAAAVLLGAGLLLVRVPGVPSWDTIFEDDYWEFFRQALLHPWHLYNPFDGYEALLPRVLGQLATEVPLAQVPRLFAVSGALVAAGVALFVFHASAGHIRSAWLRAMLGAAVVLLPVAPMEVADNGVDTIWYLMLAAFWALLWRPKTNAGRVMAALVAFGAASGEVMCGLFLPLVAARLFVLRRPRDHAVTAGWLAGCLLQVPAVLAGGSNGTSRLTWSGPPGQSLAFYAHSTVLPVFGWHLSWHLRSLAGTNGATVIAAVILAVILGAIVVTQPRNRPFVAVAVLTGLAFSVIVTTIDPDAVIHSVTPALERGSRYSVLSIFLLQAVMVAGVDHVLRPRAGAFSGAGAGSGFGLGAGGWRRLGVRPALAVAALAVVLGASWVADFRYAGIRSAGGGAGIGIASGSWAWGPIAARWKHDCERSRSGQITEKVLWMNHQVFQCGRLLP